MLTRFPTLVLVSLFFFLSACESAKDMRKNVTNDCSDCPVSITVTSSTGKMEQAKGLTLQLTATELSFTNATLDVTADANTLWNSSDATIVSVNGGLVTANKIGTATITADRFGVKGSVTFTVLPPPIASLAITPTAASKARGLGQQYAVTATYTDGTTGNISADPKAVWSTTLGTAGTIVNGLATSNSTAVVNNTYAINFSTGSLITQPASCTAQPCPALTISANLTVLSPLISSIAVTPANASQTKGLSTTYTATATNTDGTTTVISTAVGTTWSDSGPTAPSAPHFAWASNVVTSNSTAGDNTTYTVTASTSTGTVGGAVVQGTTNLTVTPALIQSLAITADAVNLVNAAQNGPGTYSTGLLPKGLTQQFTVTGTYTDATTANITALAGSGWVSSAPAVATVGANTGLATAVATTGTATLTYTTPAAATNGGTAISITGSVTAAPALLQSIALTAPAVPAGFTGAVVGHVYQYFPATYTAMGSYSDGTQASVSGTATWSVTAGTGTATAAAGGTITATAAGTITIKATQTNTQGVAILGSYAGTSATVSTFVNTPTGAVTTVNQGATLQFNAVATYSDTATYNANTASTWTSSNTALATVGAATGLVTALNLNNSALAYPDRLTVQSTGGSFTTSATWNTLVATSAAVALKYKVQGTVTGHTGNITMQNNMGDNITIAGGTGTFAFTFPTQLANAATYSVTVSAQPTGQSCTVINGSGAIGTTNIFDVRVNCTKSRYAVISTAIGADLRPVESTSGALYRGTYGLDNTTATTMNPAVYVTTVTQSTGNTTTATCVYMAHALNNLVSVSTVAANGQMTSLSTNSKTTTNPNGMAVDPWGLNLYVANGTANTITKFPIQAGCTLGTAVVSTAKLNSAPKGVVVDPSGTYVYVSNSGLSTVSQYNAGNLNWVADFVSSAAPTPTPSGLAMDKLGRYLFVANNTAGTVRMFSVTPNSSATTPGALTAVGTDVTATGVASLVVHPTGKYLYAGGSTPAMLNITATGLTAGATYGGVVAQPTDIDPNGNFLLMTNTPLNEAYVYGINATGALTLVNKYFTNASPGGGSLVTGPTAYAMTPTFAAIADTLGSVATVAITPATGVLANNGLGAITTTSTATTGANPTQVAADPFGRYVYTSNKATVGSISATSVSSTGMLGVPTISTMQYGGSTTSTASGYIATEPSGRWVYATCTSCFGIFAPTPAVGIFTAAGAAAGSLTTGTDPRGLDVDPTGRFVYVADATAKTILMTTLNQTTGALTLNTPSTIAVGATALGPWQPRVDPTGKYLYVNQYAENKVYVFGISSVNGSLTALATPSYVAGTVSGANALEIDPLGRFLYSVGLNSNGILPFTITGGALTAGTQAGTTFGNFIAADPSGAYLYTHVSGVISFYPQTGGVIGTKTSYNTTTGANGGVAILGVFQ